MEEKGVQRCFVLIIILLSSYLISMLDPISAQDTVETRGLLDPTIWVETEGDSYPCCVEPGHADEVTIHGTLYCEFATGTPPGTQVNIELMITSNFDYQGFLYHTFIKGQEEDPLDFHMDLPDMTASFSEREYHLTMDPRWFSPTTNKQGVGDNHTVSIEPLPYGSVLIIPPKPLNFNVGEMYTIDLEIKNRGNCRSSITIGIESNDLIIAARPDCRFELEAGASGIYPLIIIQESGLGKDGDLIITARSSIPGDHNSDKITMHYTTHTDVSQIIRQPVSIIISLGVFILLIVMVILVVRKIRHYGKSR